MTSTDILGPCAGGGTHDHRPSGIYRLGSGNVGYTGQPEWKLCKKCQVLAFSGKSDPGTCPPGGSHDYSSSADYTVVLTYANFDDSFNAHETGHCFGLGHSWSANPDTEYGDRWDIMSALNVNDFDNRSDFTPAGPGLNAPTLYRMGWLPEDRIVKYNAANTTAPLSVNLLALNRPEEQGTLMVLIQSPNHLYTVEFRRPSGWDTGIPRDAVLIHELRSTYLVGQRDWRWCNKCQGLTWTGFAPCAAGSVHDHSQSVNYNLVLGNPADPGQKDWRHCIKCQGLVYAANSDGPGPCPAGDNHSYGSSGNYSIPIHATSFNGQTDWNWCRKCQGLAYAGNASPGTCPAGDSHDYFGSANYTLAQSAFIETLKPNSRDLMDISEDFRPISTKYAIISFFEQDVYSGIGAVVRLLSHNQDL